jgi:TPR repeat protein
MRTVRGSSLLSVLVTALLAVPAGGAVAQDTVMVYPEAIPATEAPLVELPPGSLPTDGAMMQAVPGETAMDAALNMANMLDGAGGGVSSDAYVAALEDAAAAGQPMAMWQLGTMYENGQGVAKDPVKAFGYFAQIANQYADAAPRGVEADIVARSFVKLGDYYREGVPDAGVSQNREEYYRVLQHAASYFGDADAQYQLGILFQQEDGPGVSAVMSARWLREAAGKGHCLAQARLGDLLFNGLADYDARPLEGLMWLNLAHLRCGGTNDAAWIDELLARAQSVAAPEHRTEALALASSLAPQFSGL